MVTARMNTVYRITARRKGHVRHVALADAEHRDRALAAWRASMRGWRVEATAETFRPWISEKGERDVGEE